METADFLFELGCEELPPKSLRKLQDALAEGIISGLKEARLSHTEVERFASPRRLAVIVRNLATAQSDQTIEKLGPNLAAAYKNGEPTPAALGFARSCGVALEALASKQTDKGERLCFKATEQGQMTRDLLPAIVDEALKRLPIAKRMRWGSGNAEFVRPVHWVVMLLGNEVVDSEILSVKSGNCSRGHRFLSEGEITLKHANDYASSLLANKVLVNFDERQSLVKQQVEQTAHQLGGQARINPDLLEEVTALVEWPVPIHGRFEGKFMVMPSEVITGTIEDHQKYFPVEKTNGELLPAFITLSNLASTQPEEIRQGNERVVKPRLEDALFFYQQDLKTPLLEKLPALKTVVFQKQLGSLFDKTQRVSQLAIALAKACDGQADEVKLAAELSRCDLLTQVVYEMPELQGRMGYYYALNNGHSESVATAIEAMYQPRFSGDDIPQALTGSLLSLADKLDTLAGIFAIGKKPTGDKDPFALRRAAIGVIRICQQTPLQLNLVDWLQQALALQPVDNAESALPELVDFVRDRARVLAKDLGFDTRAFNAVSAISQLNPADLFARVTAVNHFMQSSDAEALAEANKRASNILRKQKALSGDLNLNQALLQEAAEQALYQALQNNAPKVQQWVNQQAYNEALTALSGLRSPLDDFFTHVMVMADDNALKQNRLALLRNVRAILSSVADIALLQT